MRQSAPVEISTGDSAGALLQLSLLYYPVTNLAALHCAVSSCLMWLTWYGSHVQLAYSRVGLTRAL